MTTVVNRMRRRISRRSDAGMTLIELMTAMTLLAVALVLLVPVLTTVTSVTSATNSTANGTAQGRLVLQQLGSDIGSATSSNVCFPSAVLATPPTTTCSSVQTSGYPLVVLSSVNSTATVPVCTWIQWNVNASNQLTQQSALKGATAWSSPVVLSNSVVNTASPSLFTFDTTNSLMNIQLLVRGANGTAFNAAAPSTRQGTQTIDLQTSVSLFTTSQSPAAGSC
jgi:prepilin-type N-terminal cleavage/methylation domain-containing protein